MKALILSECKVRPRTIIPGDKEHPGLIIPEEKQNIQPELYKVHALLSDSEPRSSDDRLINQLIHKYYDKEPYFTPADSNYLIFQNSEPESIIIDTSVFQVNVWFTKKIRSALTDTDFVSYYAISIPVFSKDLTHAYIQLNFVCTGLCGSGYEYLLAKQNGKWIIIKKRQTWVS